MSRLLVVIVAVLVGLVSTAGCTVTQNVRTAANDIQVGSIICVENNPKVIEADILDVIEQSILDNGFVAEVYDSTPETCELKLTYVAYQKWDAAKFLSQAKIRLYKHNRLIGSVEYKTPQGIFGGGGINPAKWDSTEEKISPLMNVLLMGEQ